MPIAKSQSGFTLIEVLVSIVIVSVGLLGLVSMQSRGIGFSMDAEDRNKAALLANELVSAMWVAASDDLSDDVIADWKEKIQSELPPYEEDDDQVNGVVSTEDGVTTITITWTPVGLGSTQHSYETQVAIW